MDSNGIDCAFETDTCAWDNDNFKIGNYFEWSNIYYD